MAEYKIYQQVVTLTEAVYLVTESRTDQNVMKVATPGCSYEVLVAL